MLVVCAIICGGATYLLSTLFRPVYQASAYLVIEVGASTHPSITESLQAVPTFAQLVTIPAVLEPVIERHPGMSIQDLTSMIAVKPQANTQIIEVRVQADNSQLSSSLANQVSQSFAQYANTGAPGTVQVIQATAPALPAQPRPLEDAGIGAAVGLILAFCIALLFEWIGDRPASVEHLQELLGMEILTLVPRFSRLVRRSHAQLAPSEKYAMVCASFNVAQASQPFKLVMFTSALAGEGKSMVVSNVAIHLARAGKQVLLVDLNVHRPAIAQHFHLKGQGGLTDMLERHNRQVPLEQYTQLTSIAGLSVLAAGTRSMNSLEFLRSLAAAQFFTRLQQTSFDYVLFDTPPLFAVAETQILASSIEALALVVNGSRTPQRVLTRTRQILWRMQTTRMLGVVVNQSSWRDYADTHPYTLVSSPQTSQPRSQVEEVTAELPTVVMRQITSGLTPGMRLPDTGETAQISQIAQLSQEPVIRPPISLSGLTFPTNGLTRRAFSNETATPIPPSLQDE